MISWNDRSERTVDTIALNDRLERSFERSFGPIALNDRYGKSLGRQLGRSRRQFASVRGYVFVHPALCSKGAGFRLFLHSQPNCPSDLRFSYVWALRVELFTGSVSDSNGADWFVRSPKAAQSQDQMLDDGPYLLPRQNFFSSFP